MLVTHRYGEPENATDPLTASNSAFGILTDKGLNTNISFCFHSSYLIQLSVCFSFGVRRSPFRNSWLPQNSQKQRLI